MRREVTAYGSLPTHQVLIFCTSFEDPMFFRTMTTMFDASWEDGDWDDSTYPQDWMNSTLILRVRPCHTEGNL